LPIKFPPEYAKFSKCSTFLFLGATLIFQSIGLPYAFSTTAATQLDNCIAAINDSSITRSTLPRILSYSSPTWGVAADRVSYSTAAEIENAIGSGTLTVWVASGPGEFDAAQDSNKMDLFCGDSHDNRVPTLDAKAGQRDIFFGGSGNDEVDQMWESAFYGGPGNDRVQNTFSENARFYGGPGTDSMNVGGIGNSGSGTGNLPTWYQESAFSLSSASQSVTLNTEITPVTSAKIGDERNLSYAISPAAPTGLTFNTSTGQLSGTPTGVQSATTYTFIGTSINGAGSSAIQTFILTVTIAPPAFTLSSSSETRTVNTAATGFTINSTGGIIASFAISATPTGMSFNTTTGALTGTPNTVASATNYTITATNASGNATQTFTLTVTTAPIATDNSVDQVAAQAETARKAREQKELTDLLALIPKIGELTLSLGETTRSLYSTKCVKGKSKKFVKKGAKCPRGFVRAR
jgi:hypothetical protein